MSFEEFSLPEGVSQGVVRLSGDNLEKDNEFRFVLSRSQAVPVALVERDRVGSPSSGFFYVESALGLSQRPRFKVRSIQAQRFGVQDIDRAAIVVLSDVSLPRGETADRLVEFVQDGGGLLVALGSRSQATSHAALASRGLLPALNGEPVASRRSSARISYFDRSHPGFESFPAPRSGDFGSARFFQYHRVLPDPEIDVVLARFDDGQPALLERRVGEGRVIVWASTLDRFWNDFALKPIFVPFLHQTVGRLSDFLPLSPWNEVGEILDVGAVLGATDAEPVAIDRIVGPVGEVDPLQGLLALEHEGFYEIELEGDGGGVVAVNLEGVESDLTSLDPAELVAAITPSPGGCDTGPDERRGYRRVGREVARVFGATSSF